MDSEYKFDLCFREMIKNDNREVPDAVRNRVNETLSSLPKRQPVIKKIRYIAAAAVLLFGFVFGLGFISPAVAQVLRLFPIIGFVFETAGDPGLQDASRQGYATPVNQTVSDNGIKLTVTEGVFDGARLSFGYIQESYFGALEIERPNIWVNGKEINFSAGYSVKVLGPSKIAGVITIDPTEELPETFDMEMVIDAMGIIPGKWDFKFPISMGKSRLVLQPGITKTYNDIEMTVKKVTLAPSATNLKIQIKKPHKYYEDFRLYDDRGMMLQKFSASGIGDESNGFVLSASFAPVKGKPKYLILRPIINEWEANQNQSSAPDVVSELTDKLPITISQGKVGTLTITRVEYLPDKTRIHYEVEGSDPYNQAWGLWIRDSKGKDYNINAPSAANPVKESDEKYAFVRELPPFKKREGLKVITKQFDRPNFIKELEVKIPLEW